MKVVIRSLFIQLHFIAFFTFILFLVLIFLILQQFLGRRNTAKPPHQITSNYPQSVFSTNISIWCGGKYLVRKVIPSIGYQLHHIAQFRNASTTIKHSHDYTPTPNYTTLLSIRFFNCVKARLLNFKLASLFRASFSDLYASQYTISNGRRALVEKTLPSLCSLNLLRRSFVEPM